MGGCVRDLELGREPADYDVCTDARPERVQELFPRSLAVGARFGVILVVEDGVQVEVATFRSDIGYSDGRHPDHVVYADTPQEDVRRRDFTINGLLMDPATGEVLDFVGGRADLRAGIVRAIGDPRLRFTEDKLRMMRAVRFAARFGFRIEPETMAAAQSLAAQITQVSPERIRDELTKLLTEGAARRGFELLDETGLLAVVLPDIAKMKGVEQPPQFHPEGDVWIHTRMLLENLQPHCSPTLAWGVLLHDVGKPPTFAPANGPGTRIRFDGHVEVGARMAEHICRALRFSNDDTEQIEGAGGQSHALQGRQADARRRRSSASCACRDLKSTWNCTAWTAWPATATWRPIPSSSSFFWKLRPKKCIPLSWSRGMISRAWGLSRDRDSRKSCWPWRRPSSKDGFKTGRAPSNTPGRCPSLN